jgi:hypothetical protein
MTTIPGLRASRAMRTSKNRGKERSFHSFKNIQRSMSAKNDLFHSIFWRSWLKVFICPQFDSDQYLSCRINEAKGTGIWKKYYKLNEQDESNCYC